MKLNYLLVAALAVMALNATPSVQAGEPLLSPKAKALAHSLRKVPGTTPDLIDRSVKPGSPKALEFARSLRKVGITGSSTDWVHAPRPTLSAKDPRLEMAWQESAFKEFEVAPVK